MRICVIKNEYTYVNIYVCVCMYYISIYEYVCMYYIYKPSNNIYVYIYIYVYIILVLDIFICKEIHTYRYIYISELLYK